MRKIILTIFLLCVVRTAIPSVYFIVMAGGVGTRLWPLSRECKPKQFLSLLNGNSLLADTFNRVNGIVVDSQNGVVTTKEYESLIKPFAQTAVQHVIVEPAMRNTAPAILLTCQTIAKLDPDALIVFLPADHFIEPVDVFKDSLKQAIVYATTHDEIVIFGIKPRYPATGYGYIQSGAEQVTGFGVYPVLAFHEKPSFSKAQEYLERGCMFWNAGIFCAKAAVFIEEFKTHAPEVFNGMQNYLMGKVGYAQLPNVAVDIAVMEKSKRVVVLPLNVVWSDIGNLREFLTIQSQHGATYNEVLEIGTAGKNLVTCLEPKKQIVLIDVNDVCVVETADALVVANKASVEKVKDALATLKKMGKTCI